MIVDAHQHFWLLKDRIGEWPQAELAAIHRDFMPHDLQPLLEEAGVAGTVLVQSLPSLDDTAFMLDLSDKNPFILGVVGWADMKATDAAATIKELARHRKLKGLRPMLQAFADDRWIDDAALEPAVTAMLDHGLVLDALVAPRHLAALAAFARRYPALPIVIDHGAKPPIAQGRFSTWRGAMEKLADEENVHCKLSGLLTEAGEQKPEAVRPYAETILDVFGPARVIWGSDWPVLQLAGDYRGWLAQCRGMVAAADHHTVFGANAVSFYGLGQPGQNQT